MRFWPKRSRHTLSHRDRSQNAKFKPDPVLVTPVDPVTCVGVLVAGRKVEKCVTNLSVASRVVGLAVVVVADAVPGLNTARGTSRVVGLRVVVLIVVVPEFRTAACRCEDGVVFGKKTGRGCLVVNSSFCERCDGGVAFGTKTGAGALVVSSAPREPCEVASLLLGKSGPGCLVVKFEGANNRGVVGLGVEGTGNRGVVCV